MSTLSIAAAISQTTWTETGKFPGPGQLDELARDQQKWAEEDRQIREYEEFLRRKNTDEKAGQRPDEEKSPRPAERHIVADLLGAGYVCTYLALEGWMLFTVMNAISATAAIGASIYTAQTPQENYFGHPAGHID